MELQQAESANQHSQKRLNSKSHKSLVKPPLAMTASASTRQMLTGQAKKRGVGKDQSVTDLSMSKLPRGSSASACATSSSLPRSNAGAQDRRRNSNGTKLIDAEIFSPAIMAKANQAAEEEEAGDSTMRVLNIVNQGDNLSQLYRQRSMMSEPGIVSHSMAELEGGDVDTVDAVIERRHAGLQGNQGQSMSNGGAQGQGQSFSLYPSTEPLNNTHMNMKNLLGNSKNSLSNQKKLSSSSCQKRKMQVNELGKLGPIKNLTKILSQNMTHSDETTTSVLTPGAPKPKPYALDSLQLFQKQKKQSAAAALKDQSRLNVHQRKKVATIEAKNGSVSSANIQQQQGVCAQKSMLTQQQILSQTLGPDGFRRTTLRGNDSSGEPTLQHLLLNGGRSVKDKSQSRERAKADGNVGGTASTGGRGRSVSNPGGRANSANHSASGQAAGNIDKIIRKNLKKQQQLEKLRRQELDALDEQRRARRHQVHMQNEIVRQLHRKKFQKSQERSAAELETASLTMGPKMKPTVAQNLPSSSQLANRKGKSHVSAQKANLDMTKSSENALLLAELSGLSGTFNNKSSTKRKIPLPHSKSRQLLANGKSDLRLQKSLTFQKSLQQAPSQLVSRQGLQNDSLLANSSKALFRNHEGGQSPGSAAAGTFDQQPRKRDGLARQLESSSQEREKRVLSGMSQLSRSGKSAGPSAKSQTLEQRGPVALNGTLTSAHAGGKKDSITSAQSNALGMGFQQSQQNHGPNSHQGGGAFMQSSQRLDHGILLGVSLSQVHGLTPAEIHELEQSQEDSSQRDLAPTSNARAQEELQKQLNESTSFRRFLIRQKEGMRYSQDYDLKHLQEQMQKVEYTGPSEEKVDEALNGNRLLTDESIQHDDDTQPVPYSCSMENVENSRNFKKDLALLTHSNKGGKQRQNHNQTFSHGHQRTSTGGRKMATKVNDQSSFRQLRTGTGPVHATSKHDENLAKSKSGVSTHKLGMDFLMVKREIQNELKLVDRRITEKLKRRTQMRDGDLDFDQQYMLRSLSNQRQSNLNNDMTDAARSDDLSNQITDMKALGDGEEETSPEHLGLAQRFDLTDSMHGRGQNALNKLRSKSSSPVIRRGDVEDSRDLNKGGKATGLKKRKEVAKGEKSSLDLLAALGDESTMQHTQSNLNVLHKQLHGIIMNQKQKMATSQYLNTSHSVYLKSELQKFIRRKQRIHKQQKDEEKMVELDKVVRVHENLTRLERYVRKKNQQVQSALHAQPRLQQVLQGAQGKPTKQPGREQRKRSLGESGERSRSGGQGQRANQISALPAGRRSKSRERQKHSQRTTKPAGYAQLRSRSKGERKTAVGNISAHDITRPRQLKLHTTSRTATSGTSAKMTLPLSLSQSQQIQIKGLRSSKQSMRTLQQKENKPTSGLPPKQQKQRPTSSLNNEAILLSFHIPQPAQFGDRQNSQDGATRATISSSIEAADRAARRSDSKGRAKSKKQKISHKLKSNASFIQNLRKQNELMIRASNADCPLKARQTSSKSNRGRRMAFDSPNRRRSKASTSKSGSKSAYSRRTMPGQSKSKSRSKSNKQESKSRSRSRPSAKEHKQSVPTATRPLRYQASRAQVNQILKKINLDFGKTRTKKERGIEKHREFPKEIKGAIGSQAWQPVIVPQHAQNQQSSIVSDSGANASQLDQFSFNPARQQNNASVAMSSTHDVPSPDRRIKKIQGGDPMNAFPKVALHKLNEANQTHAQSFVLGQSRPVQVFNVAQSASASSQGIMVPGGTRPRLPEVLGLHALDPQVHSSNQALSLAESYRSMSSHKKIPMTNGPRDSEARRVAGAAASQGINNQYFGDALSANMQIPQTHGTAGRSAAAYGQSTHGADSMMHLEDMVNTVPRKQNVNNPDSLHASSSLAGAKIEVAAVELTQDDSAGRTLAGEQTIVDQASNDTPEQQAEQLSHSARESEIFRQLHKLSTLSPLVQRHQDDIMREIRMLQARSRGEEGHERIGGMANALYGIGSASGTNASPHISQINIDRGSDSRCTPGHLGLHDEPSESAPLPAGFNEHDGPGSEQLEGQSGLEQAFQEYFVDGEDGLESMPESLHSLSSRLSKMFAQEPPANDSYKTAPVADVNQLKRAKTTTGQIIDDQRPSGGKSMEAGAATYQPENELYFDDQLASAQRDLRTLVSHLLDVECEDEAAQDTIHVRDSSHGDKHESDQGSASGLQSTEKKQRNATLSQAHRNSEMNIRGAIETMKNGRELIDDEFISPKNRQNRVEMQNVLDLDISGAKSNNMNPASQHVTENLLKHIEDNIQLHQQHRNRNSSVRAAEIEINKVEFTGIVDQEELPEEVLELALPEDPSPYDNIELPFDQLQENGVVGLASMSERVQESRRSNQFVNSPDQMPLPYQESGGRHSYLESERVESKTEEEESHGREGTGEKPHESPQIESNLIIDREKIQAAFDEHLNGQGSGVAKTPASGGRGQPEPMISRASVAHSGGPHTDGTDASPAVIMNPHNPQLTTYLDSEIGTPAGKRSDEKQREAAAAAPDNIDPPQVPAGECSERQLVRNLQNEMNINSDLTTLNIDGENSSSDGGAHYNLANRREGDNENQLLVRDEEAENGIVSQEGASTPEDEKKQLEDARFLQKFRKRQQKLMQVNETEQHQGPGDKHPQLAGLGALGLSGSIDLGASDSAKEQGVEDTIRLNQIEIEIQENGSGTSLDPNFHKLISGPVEDFVSPPVQHKSDNEAEEEDADSEGGLHERISSRSEAPMPAQQYFANDIDLIIELQNAAQKFSTKVSPLALSESSDSQAKSPVKDAREDYIENSRPGQSLKIADILQDDNAIDKSRAVTLAKETAEAASRKRKHKKYSRNVKMYDRMDIAKVDSQQTAQQICQSIIMQIVDNLHIFNPPSSNNSGSKSGTGESSISESTRKRIISSAQREIEQFRRPQEQTQSIEEYHENLFKQAQQRPKLVQIKPEEVLSYLRMNINVTELKHQIKQVLEMKQRQNIEQDLLRADEYVNELLQYLLQFEILQSQEDHEALLRDFNGGVNYLTVFLTNLTQPMRRDLLDELRKLQTQDLGSYSHFESCLDPLKFPILPIDMYLDVEKHRQFTYQQAHPQERQDQLQRAYASNNSAFSAISALSASIGQESMHILNKAIFDAMNESLTKFRPYGMIGDPLPWSNRYRRLQTEVDTSSVDTERLFQMVKQEVYRWMSAQQGALTHSEEDIFGFIDLHIPLMPEIRERIEAVEDEKELRQLSNLERLQLQSPTELTSMQEAQMVRFKRQLVEDCTSEMRHAKIQNLAYQEILEDEHQWLNYEFEETQIRIDLSEVIFETLVQETVEFLQTKQQSKPSSLISNENEAGRVSDRIQALIDEPPSSSTEQI